MRAGRWMTGLGLGAIIAAGLVVAPAIQAQENRQARAPKRSQPTAGASAFGMFTPAAADPRLAAVLGRSGMGEGRLRFTPAESRRPARGVEVAVRARSTRGVAAAPERAAAGAPVGVAPISYNLGVSVGWKRFTVSGDVTRIDLVNQPGGLDRTDIGVAYTGRRASGRVTATADRPVSSTPSALAERPSYSIDVGGSYALTRNLDVTAGVRYKSERERVTLPRLTDEARDSQAVYVGTAFRF